MPRQTQKAPSATPKESAIRNLLILEDNDLIRSMYHDVIDHVVVPRIGAIGKVHYAISGNDALSLASQHKMDAFIVDRNVPGIRGDDFAHIMRRMNPLAPVIVASAEVRDRDLGEDSYLRKPFTLDDMENALAAADAMVSERSKWSPEQVVDFMGKARGDSRRVNSEVIRVSGWPPGKVEEYVGVYRRVFMDEHLDPILSFSPADYVAMVNRRGDLLLNLFDSSYHSRFGPPRRPGEPHTNFLAGAEYIATHERMHVYDINGFLSYAIPDVSAYQAISPWDFHESGRGLDVAGMCREVAVDSAALMYGTASSVASACAYFREDEPSLHGDSLALPSIAYRQVVCERYASSAGVDGPVSARLAKLGGEFAGLAGSKVSARQTDVGKTQMFYDRMIHDFGAVFDETTLLWDRIRAHEESKRRV